MNRLRYMGLVSMGALAGSALGNLVLQVGHFLLHLFHVPHGD